MKRISILLTILAIVLYSFLSISGCNKEDGDKVDTNPPPEFYEFGIKVGDGHVSLSWNFPGLENYKYGVEVTYYLNDVKKVQKTFGDNRMTIFGLTNNVTYTFTLVTYDAAGNRSDGFNFNATPTTPFVIVSPANTDDYSIENGKVRIDLRFNRLADTTNSVFMNSFLYLKTDLSEVSYTFTWLEEGMVLSLLTTETKETFCTTFPCHLYLRFHFPWMGGTIFSGISDTNGVFLDADNDGAEMGEGELTFILE